MALLAVLDPCLRRSSASSLLALSMTGRLTAAGRCSALTVANAISNWSAAVKDAEMITTRSSMLMVCSCDGCWSTIVQICGSTVCRKMGKRGGTWRVVRGDVKMKQARRQLVSAPPRGTEARISDHNDVRNRAGVVAVRQRLTSRNGARPLRAS